MLTNATPALASLTVRADRTLTFDGWDTLLSATDVEIAGTMTHAQNTATAADALGVWVPNARVNIACSNLTVSSDGEIDASLKGYLGGQTANQDGCGPGRGRGRGTDSSDGGAAGYGGFGGQAYKAGFMAYGLPYGTASAPVEPGSGGGSGNTDTADGGTGGGVVRIVALGTVTVDGAIHADGGIGPTYGAGDTGAHDAGGAGGGIFIACRRFSGTSGVIAANGGTGRDNRSGGGGRIAIWQKVPPDYDEFLTAHAEEQTMLDGFTGTVAVTAPASGIVPAAESGTIRYYTLNPWSVVIVVR